MMNKRKKHHAIIVVLILASLILVVVGTNDIIKRINQNEQKTIIIDKNGHQLSPVKKDTKNIGH